MAEEPSLHRIAKLLARAGVASRRDVERMIEDGRVALNGTTIDTPATLLATLVGVTVDGEPVAEAEPTRLFLFHKPAGYLTAARDPLGRPTIYDRLPADLPRLVPVGRLDLNTEGLLLLTTDGEFKRQLELPATGVERAYRARAYGDVTQAQLEELIDGVEIDGIRYGSIDANLERRTGANVWVEMILTEGKNREVRNVLEHLGLQVSRLIRTRYGPFLLGDLPVGGIGEVRGADLVAFRHRLKNTRLPPAQVSTITAAPITSGGAAAKPSTPQRNRTEHQAQNASARAPQGDNYDPTRARAPLNRTRTPGAFGARPPRASATEQPRGAGRFVADRTTDRASNRDGQDRGFVLNDRHRDRPARGSNEPDAARTRRAIRDDRTGSRNRSGAVDAAFETRPFRDGSPRGDRPTRSRSERGEHAAKASDRTRPERGRSQQPGRGTPDPRAARTGAPRPTTRDEGSETPRPPRPERKPGWARAKPKPGARPGKPRK